MLLRFLGTGSAFTPGRMFSSVLLNDRVLIDPSPTSPVALKYLGIPPGAIHTVLVTHMHGDHFMGLPFLLLHWHYRDPPERPIEIYTPVGGEKAILKAAELSYPNLIEKVDLKRIWRVREVSPGKKFTTGSGMKVEVFEMDHASIPAQGCLMELDGLTVGVTGDTDLCPGLEDMAERSDILITELSSWERDIPSHLSRSKLEALTPHLRGIKHLFLTHTEDIPAQSVKEHLRLYVPGEVYVPNDLSTYVIE